MRPIGRRAQLRAPLFLLLFRLSPLGLALLLAACSTADSLQADGWTGRIDTLDSGEIRVSNPPTGLWSEEEVPRIVEQLRIGKAEGSDPAVFGAISLFDVDEDGRVWIFDEHSRDIRVFDRDGRFVRSVGRPGEGPGEFHMVIGMDRSPQGDLWVLDPGLLRFSIFEPSGEFLRGQRVEGGSIIMPWPGGFDRDGTLLHYGRRPSEDGSGFDLVMIRYAASDSTMVPLDTLRIPHFERTPPFEIRAGTRYMSVSVPFAPSPVWRLSPRGEIWWTTASEYTLHQSSRAGDTLLTIVKEFSPSEVTAGDIDAAVRNLSRFTEAGGRIDPGRIPDTKPALGDFFFDDRDRVWVIPFEETENENPELDVFDDGGRFLGTVKVPFPFETNPPPIVRDGVFYAVTKNEFDVPAIVRGRILPSR